VCQISSKSGDIFVEIWRFNNFQDGGRPPSLIFEIWSLCHVTAIPMDDAILLSHEKFHEIGQLAAELWPKNNFQYFVRHLEF